VPAATANPPAARPLDSGVLLAREARERPLAAWAAGAAGLLQIGSGIGAGVVQRDMPAVSSLETLQVAAGGAVNGRAGLRSEQFRFLDDHFAAFVALSVVQALSFLLFGYALLLIFRAASGRAPGRAITGPLAIAGAVGMAVGGVLSQVGSMVAVRDAVAAQQWTLTPAANSVALTGQTISFFGSFVLAAAAIMISLAAMRTGLFTRFLGILGVMVGVLTLLPIPPLRAGAIFLQALWLIFVAVGLHGIGRAGLAPGWAAGKAVPWPSPPPRGQQAAAARGRVAPAGPAPQRTAAPSPSTSAKKKRKRR